MDHNKLQLIPPELRQLIKLENIYLNDNELESIPLEWSNKKELNIYLTRKQLNLIPGDNLCRCHFMDHDS